MGGDHETITLESTGQSLPRSGFGRGTVLGRYVILRALGSGGMGIVYVAYDAELEREVAIKLLRWQASRRGDADAQARLLNEAKALAKLSHPHVVQVFDTGLHGDHVYFVMELIDGVTLTHWLASASRSRRAIIDHFRDAGRGLAAIHCAGLVHRDVKPSNMIIGRDARLRIVDLGLASALAGPTPGDDAEVGEPGQVQGAKARSDVARGGTPAYMAPEQCLGGVADARSDQFSFCASLLEALGGRPMMGHGRPRSAAPTGWVPQRRGSRPPGAKRLSGWLCRLLQRGLARDPADRFPSMDEIVTLLSRHPTYARRAVAAVTLLTVGTATAGLEIERRSIIERQEKAAALMCSGAAKRLEGVWDLPRSADLLGAFSALEPPYAQAVGQEVARQFDRHARRWVVMHTEVCEATHIRGEQSEQLMDLRMACLEDRRRALASAADLLMAPDEGLLAKAMQVAAGVPTPDACADVRTLLAMTPRPQDAETVQQMEQVADDVARSKALENAGRLDGSRADAESALRVAERVDYPPLIARTRRRLAEVMGRLGKMDAMRSGLLQALAAAHRGRADREAAHVWLDLIITEWFAGRFEEATRYAAVAEASIARIGGDSGLESTLHNRVGMLANRQGQFAVAIEHFERSRALFVRDFGAGRLAFAPATTNLAIAYHGAGRHRDAERVYRQKLALLEATFGKLHPHRAQVLHNLRGVYGDLGEPRRAVEMARQGWEVANQIYGPAHAETALHGLGLGEALLAIGDRDEALAHIERARSIFAESDGDPIHDADAASALARALRDLGREPEIWRPLAREASAGYRALGARAKNSLARLETWSEIRNGTGNEETTHDG